MLSILKSQFSSKRGKYCQLIIEQDYLAEQELPVGNTIVQAAV